MQVKHSIRPAKPLNVKDHKSDTIKAGHLIILDLATGDYKPMPVNEQGKEYAKLPSGYQYEGFLTADISVKKPMAQVMTDGTIFKQTLPYSITSFQSAVRSALPNIIFRLTFN
jgi:hypothetical protein